MPTTTAEQHTDVLVVGGGVGGIAAALAACEGGARVTVVEPYGWIGGQLTSQAVPPDEHPWIETHGSTASYRRFRQGCATTTGAGIRWRPTGPPDRSTRATAGSARCVTNPGWHSPCSRP